MQAGCTWNGGADAGADYAPIGWVPFPGTAHWTADYTPSPASGEFLNASNGNPAFPDALSPRGAQFTEWLSATPGAVVPWPLTDSRRDVDFVYPPSVTFALATLYNNNFDAGVPELEGGPDSVLDYTFDTPLKVSDQPGRVMFTDMHLSEAAQIYDPPTVTIGTLPVPIFNSSYTAFGGAHECAPADAGLNMQERVAEYLFFDLGACTGSGLGVAPPIGSTSYYDSETYTLDLCMAPSGTPVAGGCPNTCSTANSSVVWRDFDFTALVPSEVDGGAWAPDGGLGPNVVFAFQSASSEDKLGLQDGGIPAGATPIYTWSAVTQSEACPGGGSCPDTDVKDVLGPTGSLTWLRVTMTLNPDSTHHIAPTLAAYKQQFDCVANQ
jgi:hypothetical protein